MSDVALFSVPPVVKTIRARCTPEVAFRAFVEQIGAWWPLATHSLSEAPETCAIEPRLGGRLYERDRDGREQDWGRIVAWEPPHRLAYTWRVNLSEEQAQLVEVTFTPVASETEVRVTHSGWEKLGPIGLPRRESYDRGWDEVFVRRFGEYLARAAMSQ